MKQAYSEFFKNNPTPKIMIINTIKKTEDIYIKPTDSKTRTAIIQSNLEFIAQTTLKPKILIYNVKNELTEEELIEDLIQQNSEL